MKKPIPLLNGPAQARGVTKFWNMITNSDDDSAEITMYGDVCSSQPIDWWTGEPEPGMYITPEGFMDDLAQVKNKSKITIKINSCGGDLYTGIAIHNALKGLKGHKTVIVEGIAASAASVIACAGDDVQVYPGSIIMIHGVAGLFYDYMTLDDLKKQVKSFDAAEQAIAEIYHAKTGVDTEKLRSKMKAETWMIGQQAIDEGFANTLLSDAGPEMSLSADKKVLLVAGVRHDVKDFRHIPNSIPVKNSAPAAKAAGANINNRPVNNPGEKGGKQTMTEQELRAQYPEIVASIEAAAASTSRAEAVAAERARLQGIEEIEAQIGDAELIRNAKYGEKPCDAAQLALAAMQKQAQQGQTFLGALNNDAKNSGASGVTTVPNAGNADEGDADAKDFNAIISAYKTMNGGKK